MRIHWELNASRWGPSFSSHLCAEDVLGGLGLLGRAFAVAILNGARRLVVNRSSGAIGRKDPDAGPALLSLLKK